MISNNTYVVSLGGSLIVPRTGIDYGFLQKFRALILAEIKRGKKFFLICGGGATSRSYQQAARYVARLTRDDLDWLGIHSTRLNAHLLRTIFRKVARPEIITDPTLKVNTNKKVVVAAGWQPGWSTDYIAIRLAQMYNIKIVINLSDIDYVYDKDPQKFAGAKKLEKISWLAFRKIVGNRWDPGLSAPFDPIASRLAANLGLEVVIMNGRYVNNLKNYLDGKKFTGTVIN